MHKKLKDFINKVILTACATIGVCAIVSSVVPKVMIDAYANYFLIGVLGALAISTVVCAIWDY